MKIVGEMGEPPFGILCPDGTRILLTHVVGTGRPFVEDFHVVVSAHTHRPRVKRDEQGRLFVNPGETSGWSFRQPSIAFLETQPLTAEILALPKMPPPPEV